MTESMRDPTNPPRILTPRVVTWALLAMAVAQSAVVKANGVIEVIYYVVAGLGWVLETNQALPDITFLLLNWHTRYPMQIGPVRSNDPTPEQRKRARREVQKIIDRYNPGTPNPF
jgi:hypothetical protein